MAELRFDITGDSSGAQRANRDYAGTADLAARGARLLADSIDKERRAKDASVAATLSLAKADRILAAAEDELSGKAEEAAVALRLQAEEEKKAREQADRLAAAQSRISSATSKLAGAGFLQPSKLALLPALIPVTAALAQGIGAVGVSFAAAGVGAVGFGALAGTVLTSASQDAQKLAALNLKLNTATTAAQKKAIQAQIKQLESTWTPAFRRVINNLDSLTQGWKLLANQVAAPAVAPWLAALTKGLQFLKPLVGPVAGIFQAWGQSLNTYFASGAGSAEVTRLATAFGRFAGLQLGQIGEFIKNIAAGVFALGKDLAGSGANFDAFGNSLTTWGFAFASWAKSKQARDDVNKFVQYLHDNGSLLTGILKDVAKFLPQIFAGASAAGTLELRVLSDFLHWIAGLPPQWAKPLLDTAGVLLLLAKTGVIKVGIQIAGGAANLLTGGVLKLSGATAATEMEAAMRSGGAAAAAEIRAAMTGGGATGGAAAAGEGAAAGGVAVRLKGVVTSITTSPAVLSVAAAAIVAGLLLRVREDLKAGISSIAGDLPKWFAGIGGVVQLSASGWANAIVSRFEKPVRASMAAFGQALLASVKADWAAITASFRAFGHAMAASWSAFWNNLKFTASQAISKIVGFFGSMTSRSLAALRGFGHALAGFFSAGMNEMFAAIRGSGQNIISWFGGFVKKILGFIGKLIGRGSPAAEFAAIGRDMMLGLEKGIKDHAHKVANASKAAAKGAVSSGALGGDALANQRLARRIFPWGAAQWPAFVQLVMDESGFNRFARNPSSGAYGIPQALPPTKLPFAGQAAGGSHAGPQLSWMFSYIAGRYGNPVNALAHENAFHWYDRGGWLMPGVTMAVNNTGRPELVVPHGGAKRAAVVINLPAGADALGRAMVDYLRQAVAEQGGGDVQVALGGSY